MAVKEEAFCQILYDRWASNERRDTYFEWVGHLRPHSSIEIWFIDIKAQLSKSRHEHPKTKHVIIILIKRMGDNMGAVKYFKNECWCTWDMRHEDDADEGNETMGGNQGNEAMKKDSFFNKHLTACWCSWWSRRRRRRTQMFSNLTKNGPEM